MAITCARSMAAALPLLLFLSGASAQAQAPIPTRTPLATIAIDPVKPVSRVEATRVDFRPGQAMPQHLHPVPVICFVAKGAVLVRIGDAPERRVAEGGVTYEAANQVVHHVRNASIRKPARLLCAALAAGPDMRLNIMLGAAPAR